MTRVMLAGGGTAGHVNPLLAVAEELVASGISTPEEILVVGTATGLESRLVPQAGYELATTARLPFPRRANLEALAFWPRFGIAVLGVMRVIRRHRPDVVAGFGGFASAPSYVAAWLTGTPLVIHEANAVPGFANRLGARLTRYVVTTFGRTRLPHGRLLGLPMARRLTSPKPKVSATSARSHFGLMPKKPTLLVTGGSQGSVTLNSTMQSVAPDILALGWQILHIVGGKNPVPEDRPQGYVALAYCDEMDKALAAATLIISRAGAATVSEIQLLGIPAIFVPYPVGNGEQEKNAEDSLRASAAVLVLDREFTPEYVRSMVIPMLADDAAIRRMADNAVGLGRPDAARAFVAVMMEALREAENSRSKR